MFSGVAATGRKRRGEGHTRREEILHAAKELFLEQGYEATTIRRIADRVGISAPALYLYFKDKEALMLALCDQTFGHLIDHTAFARLRSREGRTLGRQHLLAAHKV